MAEFESPAVAKRELQVEFGEQTSGVNYIRDTFERFCETGTVEDRQSSGRTRTITEEKIDKVHDFIQDEPQSSVRTVVTACSIVLITAYRIMTENFSLKPYKVQFVQELEFSFFSDEATFYLRGLVNKHNIRYWCENNPHVSVETVMNSPKLNVWCAMSKNQIIGSFFFDDDTVNGQNYLSIPKEFFVPEIRKLHRIPSIIFQQDGAPPHFAVDVRQYLNHHFPGRWIGRGGPIR
ncbi:unnamed protein product [Rotaria magnacalcarata]|uniref:Transposase n=1 Tax=Rotaria magnacalcarata TaxID=392030 RepID=A0A8S2K3Y2_9BILA|nr:unnamed protein product [Rotaria magnacalcarata]